MHVPRPGRYWYHPHIREDYGQEMGLYGNILVEPADPAYWPPSPRGRPDVDDILLEDGRIAPFSRTETTQRRWGASATCSWWAARPTSSLSAWLGEVVRFHLTDTANTRVFGVDLPGSGSWSAGTAADVEHEQFVEEVILAPSERVVVDVLF